MTGATTSVIGTGSFPNAQIASSNIVFVTKLAPLPTYLFAREKWDLLFVRLVGSRFIFNFSLDLSRLFELFTYIRNDRSISFSNEQPFAEQQSQTLCNWAWYKYISGRWPAMLE